MTPLKYKDGNGKEKRTQLHFELDPIELTDWTFENPFEANELRASLIELRDISEEESRDLTQEEIRTMLGVIKLLAQISAGRPTDDGEYFLKDPNWTSSYAYRGFRTFLLTNPKEVQQFLTSLLDNDTMEEFTKAISEANAKIEEEEAQQGAATSDSGEDTAAKMQERMRQMEAENAALKAQTQAPTQLPPGQ
jgi:hypothetical protein